MMKNRGRFASPFLPSRRLLGSSLTILMVAGLAPARALAQATDDDLVSPPMSAAPVVPSAPVRSEVATPAPDLGRAPVAPEPSRLLYEDGGLAGLGLAPGVKLGGSFSGTFTELGASPDIELELGYLLPPLQRSFEVFFAAAYTQPKTERRDVVDSSGTGGASRLDAPMSYNLTQQQFVLTLGALYRLPLPIPLFRPYGALGGRLYLMKTNVDGATAGEVFGENREGAVSPGFYAALGGELQLGPGAVLLEAQLGYASIDGFVMRNTNAGATNLALGYRLFL